MISLLYGRKQIQRYLGVSIALSWNYSSVCLASMGFYYPTFYNKSFVIIRKMSCKL